MMKKRLAFAKYGFSVEDDHGNILLFNALHGTKSLCKITCKDFENINDDIRMDKLYSTTEKSIVKGLIKKGIIISEDVDEEGRLSRIFLDTVADKKLNLIISPTEKCNLRCQYCCESFEYGEMPETVIDGIVKYIESRIRDVSSVNIDWFGGEPLLALDTILELSERVIRLCKENRKPYSAFMSTNGLLLTADVFKKLYQAHVFTYQVTLDVTRELHDSQRVDKHGNPTFDRILANLMDIRNTNYGKFSTIVILSNFSTDMFGKIKEYKRFFSDRFGDDKRFAFSCFRILDLGGERIDKFRPKLMTDGKEMNRIYKEIIECKDYKLRFVIPEFFKPGGLLCYAAKENSFLVGSNGDVFKCEHTFQIRRDQPIGHITKEGKMVLSQEKADLWLARYMFCGNHDCKFVPLCLGEDCIENRIYGVSKPGNPCINRLCHFDKETVHYAMKIMDSEMNAFPML